MLEPTVLKLDAVLAPQKASTFWPAAVILASLWNGVGSPDEIAFFAASTSVCASLLISFGAFLRKSSSLPCCALITVRNSSALVTFFAASLISLFVLQKAVLSPSADDFE